MLLKNTSRKKEDYQRRIKYLEGTISQLQADMSRLAGENGKLLAENDSLKDWVERLLSYTELSKEDIKKVCEQDKKRGEAMTAFISMTNILNGYF